MKVVPLAFDSMGVRSMATYVETQDAKILIDPGVSLAPMRYGLPPHPIELQRMEEAWTQIKDYARRADILVVTHYHYDHHDPTEPEIYEGKIVYIKHPTEKINLSQRGRAAYFLEVLGDLPETLEFADGRGFSCGETTIAFSQPVCHGTNPRLGYVLEVAIGEGDDKLVFTSDVEGPSLDEQVHFIRTERPTILIVDGPMSYMLGFRYSFKSVQLSVQHLVSFVRDLPLQTLIVDHHFMRDLRYERWINPVREAADQRGVKVSSAAEYLGRRPELLEARRKELYQARL